MQNQLVNCTLKGLWSVMPGQMNKKLSSLTHQRYFSSRLMSEMHARDFSSVQKRSLVPLPGGGLEKFQGRFKEEKYFHTNDHNLLAQIKQVGFNLKAEKDASDWQEFERMATACTKIIAQRQKNLSYYKSNKVYWTEF